MFQIDTASGHRDLLERLHAFLTTNGSAFGLAYAGVGNGPFSSYRGGTASVAETWTITATSATNFTVLGSVSGSQAAATVGTPYTAGNLIAFTITAGGTAFVAGDVFTISTTPPWVSRRQVRGATVSASSQDGSTLIAVHAMDRNRFTGSTTDWASTGLPAQIEFTFGAAVSIAEYLIQVSIGTDGFPTAWTLESWNGSAWVTADTRSGQSWVSDQFRLFTVSSPPSSTRWRLNISASTSSRARLQHVEMRQSVGGIDQIFPQYIWEGPGNDDQSAIFVGATHFQEVGADYYNIEMYAFDGFTSSLDMLAQPGVTRRAIVPLWDSSIPYWFAVNGRRFVCVAQVSTQYECFYAGFIKQYATPGQWAYPLCLGGSFAVSVSPPALASQDWRWSNTAFAHSAFPIADYFGGSAQINNYQLKLRLPSGLWQGFAARNNGAPIFGSPTIAGIHPWMGDVDNIRQNLDASYSLFPASLNDAVPNQYGELDGIFWVTGQSLGAGSDIVIAPSTYKAFPNIQRTAREEWFALKLD